MISNNLIRMNAIEKFLVLNFVLESVIYLCMNTGSIEEQKLKYDLDVKVHQGTLHLQGTFLNTKSIKLKTMLLFPILNFAIR